MLSWFRKNKEEKPRVHAPSMHPKAQEALKKTQALESGANRALAQVKNVIAVASGKGGVGKSTVTTNLAAALREQGYKVGVMDADIYGPSQAALLGSNEKPAVFDNMIVPVEKHGIKFMSMALLGTAGDRPVVWRAPMATKAVDQFLRAVRWGELDYLLIDLPPGTGDIHLTLTQLAPLSGAVIVTTPQKIASDIAARGLQMFKEVNVPILGVIENMSGFICSHCGKETSIFKKGGAKDLAEKFKVPMLASIPLDPRIMEESDSGEPIYLDKSAQVREAFLNLTNNLVKELDKVKGQFGEEPSSLQVKEDGSLELAWGKETPKALSAYDLRVKCQCALCVDEFTGKPLLDPKTVPLDIKIGRIDAVGRYGLSIHFSDGHNTGIYHFKKLRELLAQAKESLMV